MTNCLKNIYELGLHEYTEDSYKLLHIRRVPGGWIYTTYTGGSPRPVFVPYSDEFKSKNLTAKK